MPHRPDLQHHHADGVGDDVVQLARDARALLRDGDAGGRLALVLGHSRAFLRRLRLRSPLAHGEAGEPGDHEEQRDEDEFPRRVSGSL